MIGNGLAYVSAAVRDPQEVAGILERDFGLRRADCAVGGTGRTAPVLVVGDTAVALFEVGDPWRLAGAFQYPVDGGLRDVSATCEFVLTHPGSLHEVTESRAYRALSAHAQLAPGQVLSYTLSYWQG